MNTEPLFVTVVMPAHNEERYIRRSLDAILTQDYPRSHYEVIVVNNNSTDATVDIALGFGVQVINEPIGPVGRVRNAGARLARGDLLLFLDSDCVPSRNWISYASDRLSSDSNLVLGGGCELRKNPEVLEKYWLLDGKEGATLPRELLGGCIAISKSSFFQVGGFDETITSGEDSKLSDKLRKQGFKVVIEREMSVIHLGNPTEFKTFFWRQIWHAENYITNFSSSVSDPTFLLISIFTVLVPTSLVLLLANFMLSLLTAMVAAAVPLLFSIKRIRRSRNLAHLKILHKIYILDVIYVAGRSLGLLKGIHRGLRKNLNS